MQTISQGDPTPLCSGGHLWFHYWEDWQGSYGWVMYASCAICGFTELWDRT